MSSNTKFLIFAIIIFVIGIIAAVDCGEFYEKERIEQNEILLPLKLENWKNYWEVEIIKQDCDYNNSTCNLKLSNNQIVKVNCSGYKCVLK